MAKSERIAVLGAGVSGLTTAIVLQLAGFPATIYTKHSISDSNVLKRRPPEFASLHAAASILPHSVASPSTVSWTSKTQIALQALNFSADCGVRRQTHYEIFEESISLPSYARVYADFELLENMLESERGRPRRQGAHQTEGWRFSVFFCEAPKYLKYLHELATRLGCLYADNSRVTNSLAEYMSLDHQIYVNCAGESAIDLVAAAAADPLIEDLPDFRYEPLADSYEKKYVLGHYLRAQVKKLLLDERGDLCSYNYTPDTDIYCSESGGPADVYCYPRTDSWLLGGSRQVIPSNLLITSYPPIPPPILTLNSELIERMTDGVVNLNWLSANRPEAIQSGYGIRFQRSGSDSGVRLSRSRIRRSGTPDESRVIVHNYGHGGSGFSLSWGCALDVLEHVVQETGLLANFDAERAGSSAPGDDAMFLADQLRRISEI